ncbi:DUF2183 domain-containing protein [Saxibacter everestensis]|uniref:DUF2183 domain-containing protein n=1 Tax=Saxibacter everestensis TaxID=2909229 RepID=A0ABY8QPF1_9MICO|nr:DUF2183 domain-containing protein [Brevibacteriaceae bacterium ZFBP1038]
MMKDHSVADDLAGPASNALHRAARLEDAFHDFRERRARRDGYIETIQPFVGYGGKDWIRVLGRVVLTASGEVLTERSLSVRGWRSFMSVPLKNRTVTVDVDGIEHRVTADRGGIIDAVLPGKFEPGRITVGVRTDQSAVCDAAVNIIDSDVAFGIISDIDDTVMVTALPRPMLAAWNTFVLNEHARTPVAGMAVLYDRLVSTEANTPIIYLSTGAWNVAPTLRRFLSRNLYPAGPLLLTDWGPTPDRIFRSGQDHKRAALERLAAEFPGMKWLLVGDDGQHDEEIYSNFVERYPQNVLAVAIRQLSATEAVWAGGRSKSEGRGNGVPWVYASDGAGLAEQLESRGLVPGLGDAGRR